MAILNSKQNMYRTSSDIYALVELMIDSYFAYLESKVGKRELSIVNKLEELEIDISSQYMNIFQSRLNDIHFRDIINQLIIPMIHQLVDKAYENVSITKKEAELMNVILEAEN